MTNKLFNEFDIFEAYRKLKTHYYYDNTDLHMRRKIADFEADSNFEQRLKNLTYLLNNNKSPEFYISTYNEIGYYTKPKSFENNIVDEIKKCFIDYSVSPSNTTWVDLIFL